MKWKNYQNVRRNSITVYHDLQTILTSLNLITNEKGDKTVQRMMLNSHPFSDVHLEQIPINVNSECSNI